MENSFLELETAINNNLKLGEVTIIDIINEGNNYAFVLRNNSSIINDNKPIICNSENVYQEIYDYIALKYYGHVQYGYSHTFDDKYYYNFHIDGKIIVRLMGESKENRLWIYSKVLFEEEMKETAKLIKK